MSFTISVSVDDGPAVEHKTSDAKSAANYIGGQMASHSDSPADGWHRVRRGISQAMVSLDGVVITLRSDVGEDFADIFDDAFRLAAEIRRVIG